LFGSVLPKSVGINPTSPVAEEASNAIRQDNWLIGNNLRYVLSMLAKSFVVKTCSEDLFLIVVAT
jgi:hypothetical protein